MLSWLLGSNGAESRLQQRKGYTYNPPPQHLASLPKPPVPPRRTSETVVRVVVEDRKAQEIRMSAEPHTQDPAPNTDAQLTHLDDAGHARMVDVGAKPATRREATAVGAVVMQPETLALIIAGELEKGDALATARIAGIMAAKQTPSLIPLCHPIPLTRVAVDLEPDVAASAVNITATVATTAQTGVEMEAMTAVCVAALTVYDMCKAVDRAIRFEGVRLVRKSGGASGDIVLE